MSNIYLQVEGSTGKLYEYSKDPKEGYVEHRYVNKAGVTSITYRKYHNNGVYGTLLNITTRDSAIGPQLSVAMENAEGDRMYINVPLQDAKSNFANYAQAIIAYMPGLIPGRVYRMFPYVIEDQKKGTKSTGVSFKYARLSDLAVDDNNLPPKLSYEVVDRDGVVTKAGDIPALEWELGVLDNPVANASKRNKYLMSVLKDHPVGDPNIGGGTKKTFDSTAEGEQTAPPKMESEAKKPESKETAKASEKTAGLSPNKEFDSTAKMPAVEVEDGAPVTSLEDDDDDDLPF